MKRYIRSGWYTGEPSSHEYGEFVSDANKQHSTSYCKVSHNNLGWIGVRVTTPYNKYCVVCHNFYYPDTYYTINRYAGFGDYPQSLISDKFSSLEDALQYLEDNVM